MGLPQKMVTVQVSDECLYSLYETTNNVNGKIYIGVHKETKWPEIDEYLGSGFALNHAIQKYGREHFTRKILCISDDPSYVYELEKRLVNEDFIKENSNYNLCGGGYGASVISENQRQKISESNKTRKVSNETREKQRRAMTGKSKTPEHRANIRKAAMGWKRPKSPELIAKMQAGRKGYKHSEETKAKISTTMKQKHHTEA